MAHSSFRLTPILRLRENERELRQAELATAQRAEEQLSNRLQDLAANITEVQQRCAQALRSSPLNVNLLRNAQRYQSALLAQRRDVERQYESAQIDVQRCREVLLAADRDVRVLVKLQQRQAERARIQEGRDEIKQLDELAGQRFARGKISE